MDLSEPFTTERSSAPATPVLRSVLLCDIVESTAMVERLGDQRAAALLRKHDVLLRQLVVFCHGQLIDKADGVLALFERPIQALDFALRYQRGLKDIGKDEGLDLKARIGLHVGDVMMWANEPRDVLAGAKAFEVEGLAKPVAARLMNLALPGQILMSGMAQNLCQRAIGELGDTGPRLRWLMHGRYRFKGVPAPMLVHEVGEPGLSPLRAPESGSKAWRELPLWRRPPVVALEVALLGVLIVGGVVMTLRSPPAIAFAERDWVVVADLQNRTEEPLFDESLDTALRIGLEQSRHINLVSELQIEHALERMQRQGQPVDRQLATELALREGARAVILPTVAEVGGVIRVSLEVIDPQSGVTVYSDSADGRGADSVLSSLDVAMGEVRGHLGEALSSVEASSLPLEQATTDNLDALRAFSLAAEARRESRLDDAAALNTEATRLDPEFAMAWLRLAFLRYVENDANGARGFLDKALAHKDRLTHRERLFLEGANATLDSPLEAIEKFRMLAAMYPDDYRARYNFAYFAHNDALRSAEAREMIGEAEAVHNPARASAAFLAGELDLVLNRYDSAIAQFEKAESFGVRGTRLPYIETYLALRRYADATRVVKLQSATGGPAQDLEARQYEVSMPLDRGQWQAALDAAAMLERQATESGQNHLTRSIFAVSGLSLRAYAPDARFAADLRTYAARVARELDGSDSLLRRRLLFEVLATGWMAASTGDAPLAAKQLALAKGEPLVDAYPASASMQRILQAEIALAAGDPGAAIARLEADVRESTGLYFSRAVLMRAYLAEGREREAAELADWLAENRGRAFAEPSSMGLWQAANIIESNLALRAGARLAKRAGDDNGASRRAAAFAAAWPEGQALRVVQRRDDAL